MNRQRAAGAPINGGSPNVVVGDIDTGLDFTHPDLAPNVDFADSASCIVASRTPPRQRGWTTTGTAPTRPHDRAPRTASASSASRQREAGRHQGRHRRGFFFPEAWCAVHVPARHPSTSRTTATSPTRGCFNCRNDAGQRHLGSGTTSHPFAQSTAAVVGPRATRPTTCRTRPWTPLARTTQRR